MKNLISGLIVFMFSAPVFAGHEVGNGIDDLIFIKNVSWFKKNDLVPAKYCIKRAPNYYLTEDDLKQMIELSYSRWRDYIVLKNIFALDSSAVPDVDLIYSQNCEFDHGIRFYFGVIDRKIKQHVLKRTRPVGFSQLETYDFEGKGTKGFIWLASDGMLGEGFPNWKDSDVLLAVLTHEIGHSLGNQHIDKTIMSDSVYKFIRSPDRYRDKLKKIDHENELTTCLNCSVPLTGKWNWGLLTRLFGIAHVNDHAQIVFSTTQNKKSIINLSLQGKMLPIKWYQGGVHNYEVQKKSFNTFYSPFNIPNIANSLNLYLKQKKLVQLGSIAGIGQKKYDILLLSNTDQGSLIVKVRVDGVYKHLYSSK